VTFVRRPIKAAQHRHVVFDRVPDDGAALVEGSFQDLQDIRVELSTVLKLDVGLQDAESKGWAVDDVFGVTVVHEGVVDQTAVLGHD
jgi:hypothetical protein